MPFTPKASDRPLERIELEFGGLRAVVTPLGARLLELWVPDRDGTLADVVLARETDDEIAADSNYLGATAGRYANRIASGAFSIDGIPYHVSRNEGENHLHGGFDGFDRKVWKVRSRETHQVVLSLTSPDGDEGFPGTLTAEVTYSLSESELRIRIEADTDAPTLANIVHHSYWNLAGHDSGSVLGHELQLDADFYTPVDDELLSSGEILSVTGTPFDFRNSHRLGEQNDRVANAGAGREFDGPGGYDHNIILRGTGLRRVGSLMDPDSGRVLTLETDQLGVQIYAGGYLASVSNKSGGVYEAYAGVTLETQTFPGGVGWSHFPSQVLRPGEHYVNEQRLIFSTR